MKKKIAWLKQMFATYINRLVDNDDYEEDFSRNYSKYSCYYRKLKM